MARYEVTITQRPTQTDVELAAFATTHGVPISYLCTMTDKWGKHHILATEGRDNANRLHALACAAGFPVSFSAAEAVR